MRAGGAPQLRQSHVAVTLPGIPSPRGPSFCSALECCRASTLRSLSPQSSLCTCAGYISMCPSHLVLLSSGYISTSPPFPQGNGLEAEQTGRRRRVSHVQRRRKESLFQLQGTRLSGSGQWGEDRIGGVRLGRLGVLRGVARRRTGTEGALFLQGTRALSTLPAISRDLRRTHARHLYFI